MKFQTDLVHHAINHLLTEIGKLTVDTHESINPDQLERLARAISTHLKALQSLDDYNLKISQKDEDEKYTRYEDLPPPSPEDQDRFYARLESVIGKIKSGERLPPTG
jgi:hypothetical protein